MGLKVGLNVSEQCFSNYCTRTAGGKRTVTCFELRRWYVYKFCTVTEVTAHVFIVTVVRVNVFAL